MVQRSRQPLLIWATTAVALVALALTGVGGMTDVNASSGDPSATATRQAELTEIAALRTEVATLRTAGAGQATGDPLEGRLGGSRAGFRRALGEPTTTDAADEDRFQVDGVGVVRVAYVADRAVEIEIARSPDDNGTVAAGTPGWTDEQADDIIQRFSPEDAVIDDASPDQDSGTRTTTWRSAGLADAAPDLAACRDHGNEEFGVAVTVSRSDEVSKIVLSIDPSAGSIVSEEVTPAASGQGGTSATVSLGGTTTVNGVRVSATGLQQDAEGMLPLQETDVLLAVEVDLRNQTAGDLTYSTGDFRLTLDDGREFAAACGGVEPAIVSGQLASSDSVHGWVSFAVPSDATPVRFTYLVGGSPGVRAGFKLP